MLLSYVKKTPKLYVDLERMDAAFGMVEVTRTLNLRIVFYVLS